MNQLKPSQIYFTHSVISSQFTGCGKLIEESLIEIINGDTQISDIPKIKVFYCQQKNGDIKYLSENNRRLWLFKELERLGKLDYIQVRLEKTTKDKYVNNTYSLNAKFKKRN